MAHAARPGVGPPFAFDEFDLGPRVKIPVVLAIHEYLRQNAFASSLSGDREQLVWQIVEAMYVAMLEKGQLTMPQFVQLGLTWKGTTNFLGWSGVSPALPPELRAQLAYVFAHRFLRLNNQPQSLDLFRTAIAGATPQSDLARLAKLDQELAQAGTGQIKFVTRCPDPLTVAIKQGDKPISTVEVRGEAETTLPAGDYQVSVTTDRTDLSLSVSTLKLAVASHNQIDIHWRWEPSTHRDPLTGLIPHPANLPGIGRWQLLSDSPRNAAALSPDGRWLAYVATDEHLHIHDGRTAQFLCVFVRRWGWCEPDALAWSPDSRMLACAGNTTIETWNVLERQPGPEMVHPGGPTVIAWSPDGHQLAAGAYGNGQVLMWSIDGEQRRALDLSADAQFATLAWHPDSRHLMTGCTSQRDLELWDVRDGSRGLTIDKPCRAVALSPDGQEIAVAPCSRNVDEPIVLIYRAADGELCRRLGGTEPHFANSVAWSANGRWIAAGTKAGWVRVWDAREQTQELQYRHGSSCFRVCWSGSGQRFVSVADDGYVRGRDLDNSAAQDKFGAGSYIPVTIIPNAATTRFAVRGSTRRELPILDPQGRLVRWLGGYPGPVEVPA